MLRLIWRLLILPYVIESTAHAQARREHGVGAGVPWLSAAPAAIAGAPPTALDHVA